MKLQRSRGHIDKIWLALAIGNSRLHWARFVGEKLDCAWDTEHPPASVVQATDDWLAEILPPGRINPKSKIQPVPLYLASVVASQTALWQTYPNVRVITLNQLPLHNTYPTLGIDRALAVWGAGETWGWPVLVVDAGTALTFTGADANRCLIGGAILPGLSLQLQSLSQKTSELPLVEIGGMPSLPARWALNTKEAIQSGVIYASISAIKDFVEAWWQEFPGSRIALTGGDRALLLACLQSRFPEVATKITTDPHLIFWGIRSYWASCESRSV